jgi:hypothetical protein
LIDIFGKILYILPEKIVKKAKTSGKTSMSFLKNIFIICIDSVEREDDLELI